MLRRFGLAAFSAGFFLVAVLSGSGRSYADTPSTADQSGALTEVIVTARKTEENLQDVPSSVTAIPRELIEDLRITRFDDVAFVTPNLSIGDSSGFPFSYAFMLRGVLSSSASIDYDNGLGLYMNGVPIGRATGSVFDLADIDHIEVLRGPQGTLFGRSSTAGTINIFTKKPTGTFDVEETVSGGDYGYWRSKTAIDLPAYGDFSMRLVYAHSQRDGYVKNADAGVVTTFTDWGTFAAAPTFGSLEYNAVLFSARYAPSERFTIDYVFDLNLADASQSAEQLLSGVLPQGSFNRLSEIAGIVNTGYNKVEGHSLTVNWDLGDAVDLKSITGFRKDRAYPQILQYEGVGVQPFAPFPTNYSLFSSQEDYSTRELSEELQLTGKAGNVSWLFGALASQDYGRQLTTGANFVQFPPSRIQPPGTAAIEQDEIIDYRSYAAYGQAIYHVTDRFNLTGGVRESVDDRELQDFAAQQTYQKTFDNFDWLVSADYHLTDNVMTYGKVATAYLAGGVLSGKQYDPEHLLSYEIGAKSEYLDHRLRVNAAAFYGDYKDIQIQQFVPPGLVQIFNAGKADIEGLELEFSTAPFWGTSFRGGYGYTNVSYKQYLVGTVNEAGVARQWPAPKNSLNLGVEYDVESPVLGGKLQFRADTKFQSTTFATTLPIALADNVTPDNPQVVNAHTMVDPYWLVNLRASIVDIPFGDRLNGTLSLWCQNVTNKTVLSGALDVSTFAVGVFTPPRTFGFDLTAKY